MNKIILSLETPGKYLVFHISAMSVILTGIVMLLSASELGPVAAFIVPLGLYTVILGMCVELLFGLRFAISAATRHLTKEQGRTGGSTDNV